MRFKFILLAAFFVFAHLSLFAQNPGLKGLSHFDKNAYQNRLKNHEKFQLYNFEEHAFPLKKTEKNAINNLKVGDDGMAPMPKMSINKDIRYSMEIKKYKLHYPYSEPERIKKFLDEKEVKTH